MVPTRANNAAAELEESLSECAPFIAKLYAMLCDSGSAGIIVWSDSADSILIHDMDRLCSDVLPRYFKHQNRSSFIRQLNTYGFRKLDAVRCEYRHSKFIKGKVELLKEITRRRSLKRDRGNDGSDDDGSDDASPPMRIFNYKDRSGQRRIEESPVIPQIIEQQRALAGMITQMRLELVAYRRELEWQSRCLAALYRYIGVGMPEPSPMDMHTPTMQVPPHMSHPHVSMMHPPIMSEPSQGQPTQLPPPSLDQQQQHQQQRMMFEQATQMYEMARTAHASGPVRKAM